MNFIIGIAAAVALVCSALVAAPTAQARGPSPKPSFSSTVMASGACANVSDVDAQTIVYGGRTPNYKVRFRITDSSFFQKYVIEKSEDAGASWVAVTSPSTSDSPSVSSSGVIGPGTRFRLSKVNCTSAGPVVVYDPIDTPPSLVVYGPWVDIL